MLSTCQFRPLTIVGSSMPMLMPTSRPAFVCLAVQPVSYPSFSRLQYVEKYGAMGRRKNGCQSIPGPAVFLCSERSKWSSICCSASHMSTMCYTLMDRMRSSLTRSAATTSHACHSWSIPGDLPIFPHARSGASFLNQSSDYCNAVHVAAWVFSPRTA